MNLEDARATASRLAASDLTKRCVEIDRDARWPEEGLRALQAAGLGGLVVPRTAGGSGLGLMGMAVVCEILGEACASTALCFGMHCVGSAVIAARATPDQTKRYLEPIARGQHLTTLALSEPGTGAHFYLPQARLVRTEGGYEITGQKTFVTNGGHADSYVVSTQASEAASTPGQFSCAVLPATARGISWGPQWNGLGMRGNSARTLTLERAALSTSDLLGEEGDEIWYVFKVVAPYFLIAMAGTYMGIARAALQQGIAHLGGRDYAHSGARLADSPVLQHRIGTLWGEVERTRQLVFEAARKGDQGAPDALVALCSAKAEVADCVVHVVNETMTLVGGRGYREGSTLHRQLRDARAAHVMAPTTDILRTWAGRELLGVPLLGD